MSTRIPSSLNWLIDKRARLDAEIQKTEQSLLKAKGLIEELSKLKESLAAIDHALSLHEIKVDVTLIRPIRSKYVRINLPYGELTRSILLYLRLHKDERHVRMSEIVSFIEARHADLKAQPGERSKLSRSVHSRLKTLAWKGVIQRHHPLKTGYEGIWSLPPDEEDK